MCGFTGELRTDGHTADPAVAARMAEALAKRGPDGSGVYASGPLALAHRRLKIIDLSDRAAQPMHDPELGLTVVFNGAIYNYPELRERLAAEGYRFFSHGDTEVVLKAYHAWGERFVERLQGMFAFVIAERDSGRLVLGRDRLGIKPLYYSQRPGVLRFASTLPALVAGGDVDATIDRVALHHYLTFHSVVPAPRTILAGVRKLEPATVMVVESDGRTRQERYWQPQAARDPERAGWKAADWQEAVHEALRLAVRRRLVADVPVGVLLSGGVDSSLVVGLLAEAGQHGLATFSVGFESVGGQKGDEFQYSDLVARTFGTDHQKIEVPSAGLLDALPGAIGAMSEPMVSHDAVAFYLLSQRVAERIKVVQSGQGADEIFAGYHWYPPMAELGAGELGVDAYARAFFDRSHAQVNGTVSADYALDQDVSRAFVAEHFAQPGADEAVDRALRLDTTVMLVDDPVKRVDNMTMAWGLEARVPFLDHEVVELAMACPPELKLAQGGKGVLKDVARKVIPAEVIDRPKGYFPVPALTYLRGPSLDLVREALHAPSAKQRGLFRPDEVERLLAEPDELTPLRGSKLWQLGLLELWLQTHVDGGGM